MASTSKASSELEEPEVPEDEIANPLIGELLDNDAFFAGLANTGPSNETLPCTLKEAFSQKDAGLWKSALEEELPSLNSNQVYKTVPISEGVKPITSKPVFQIKYNQNGNMEQYKIWIVTRGFTQQEEVDYQEVFAPVANLELIQIIIALTAKYNLELDCC